MKPPACHLSTDPSKAASPRIPLSKASTTARDIDIDHPSLLRWFMLGPHGSNAGPRRVQNVNVGVLTGPIRVQMLSPEVLGFQRKWR